MKTTILNPNLNNHLSVALLLLVTASGSFGQSSATSISFQGALNGPNNAPLANGVYDLRFRFWDGPAPGGSPVSTNILVAAAPVTNGQVSTAIPVDAAWFNGQARYLGVSVGGASELLPRVLVTAVPYAMAAASLNSQSGTTEFSRLVVRGPGDNEAVSLQVGGEVPVIDIVKTGGGESAPVLRVFRDYPKSEATLLFSIQRNGAIGIGTASPEASLDVRGTSRTRVLQITGGADLAEHLSVSDSAPHDAFNVVPGMVVSIDPGGQRKFKLSDEPYDRKRVGIISGGNGVKPGLVLRDEGNPAADGEHPIALTGQVWCHADASFGSIEPGDLLTTSRTPGHAKRVSDFDRARFAVLGQALTGLKDGRGWVQVLVGKQ